MKWWEKTVEYLFVLLAVRDHNVIAPLDGIEELAGDAIFCSKNKWILIEFKKDEASINDENRKFKDLGFKNVMTAFKDKDGHHFIIYGKAGLLTQSPEYSHIESLRGNSPPLAANQASTKVTAAQSTCDRVIRLCFQTYFSQTKKDTIEDMLKCGADLHSFVDYVTEFIRFKKPPSGPGGIGADYMLVAGINADNEIVECMSLKDFIEFIGAYEAKQETNSTNSATFTA
jgi:hypothetical protein